MSGNVSVKFCRDRVRIRRFARAANSVAAEFHGCLRGAFITRSLPVRMSMLKSGIALGIVVALTLCFYLLAYYFLPPPPPSSAMMVLFAGIAIVVVWLARMAIGKLRARKRGSQNKAQSSTPGTALVFLLIAWQMASPGGTLRTEASRSEAAPTVIGTICHFTSGPREGTEYEHPPAPVGDPCDDGAGSKGYIVQEPNHPAAFAPPESQLPAVTPPARLPLPPPPEASAPALPHEPAPAEAPAASPRAAPAPTPIRITGVALLPQPEKEESGYGLYSYALLARAPGKNELPKYQAFLRVLLELPPASDLANYIAKGQINITYIPVKTATPSGWDDLKIDDRVDFVIAHYDYARAAVLLALLPQKTGIGPVITSVLVPISSGGKPHPVLVQDLTTAQPALMDDYVSQFVSQAAQDRFWDAKMLDNFRLTLRNLLETAAIGVGLSQDAVKSWITFFK
jgi:hypothetical protein